MSTSSQTAGVRLRMSSPGVVFRGSTTCDVKRFVIDNGKPLKAVLPAMRGTAKAPARTVSHR